MANSQHLDILKQGVDVWNQWREDNPEIRPDLQRANLQKANLQEVNLSEAILWEVSFIEAKLWRANLMGAALQGANIWDADLREANLSEANLWGVRFWRTDLREANLQKAFLFKADLQSAELWKANLREADLSRSSLINTVLDKADLSGCRIYGISAWDISLKETIQSDLIITRKSQPIITVDNLEVAQFIYLLLNNEKIRDVIDTIAKKAVLILGNFGEPDRKFILDIIKSELRKYNYLPILFDFKGPSSRNTTETMSTLAHIAKFVIADITHPRCVPHELKHIVPILKSVPIQPLLQVTVDKAYSMFDDIKGHTHVLEIYQYKDIYELITSFKEKIIVPSEGKLKELLNKKGT